MLTPEHLRSSPQTNGSAPSPVSNSTSIQSPSSLSPASSHRGSPLHSVTSLVMPSTLQPPSNMPITPRFSFSVDSLLSASAGSLFAQKSSLASLPTHAQMSPSSLSSFSLCRKSTNLADPEEPEDDLDNDLQSIRLEDDMEDEKSHHFSNLLDHSSAIASGRNNTTISAAPNNHPRCSSSVSFSDTSSDLGESASSGRSSASRLFNSAHPIATPSNSLNSASDYDRLNQLRAMLQAGAFPGASLPSLPGSSNPLDCYMGMLNGNPSMLSRSSDPNASSYFSTMFKNQFGSGSQPQLPFNSITFNRKFL